MKILLIILFIVLTAIIIVLYSIYSFQERLIFFPQKLKADHKFTFKEKFEELYYETEKNTVLHALFFPAPSSKGLILYFHGNAGCLDTWGEVAKDFLQLNYDVLLVDFRGYGKSSGIISSENQLHDDAEFIYRKMLEKYPENKIVIYGRSLGSGIATKLASAHNPKKLILETPFYSMKDVARTHFPFLPAFLILKYRFENFYWLKKTNCPIFLIHGTKDEVVPYNSSTRLAEISERFQLTTIMGGSHNDLSSFPEFHSTLKNILR